MASTQTTFIPHCTLQPKAPIGPQLKLHIFHILHCNQKRQLGLNSNYIYSTSYNATKSANWASTQTTYIPHPTLQPKAPIGPQLKLHIFHTLHCNQKRQLNLNPNYIYSTSYTATKSANLATTRTTYIPHTTLQPKAPIGPQLKLHIFHILHCNQKRQLGHNSNYIYSTSYTATKSANWATTRTTYIPHPTLQPKAPIMPQLELHIFHILRCNQKRQLGHNSNYIYSTSYTATKSANWATNHIAIYDYSPHDEVFASLFMVESCYQPQLHTIQRPQ